jgi:alpha/beta superfamily hydrolase
MEVYDELIRVPLAGANSVIARVTCREGTPPERLLVLFPPHPSLAGDTENNVIGALARAGIERGRLVLRLRYRHTDPAEAGNGPSLTFWDDLDARQDYALVVADCLHLIETVRQSFHLSGPIEMVAYSFGVYPALHALGRLDQARLIGISPPLSEHDFRAAIPATAGPGHTVFIGTAGDPFCPPDTLRQLAETAGAPCRLFETGDHFYRGEEDRLATAVLDVLDGK